MPWLSMDDGDAGTKGGLSESKQTYVKYIRVRVLNFTNAIIMVIKCIESMRERILLGSLLNIPINI